MDKFTADNLYTIIGMVLVGLLLGKLLLPTIYNPDELPTPDEVAKKEKRRRILVVCSVAVLVVQATQLVVAGMQRHQGPWTWQSGAGFEVTFPCSTQRDDKLQQTSFGKVLIHRACGDDSSIDAGYNCEYVDVGVEQGLTVQKFMLNEAHQFGPVLSERPIEVDGWHGTEAAFSVQGKYHMTIRCVIGQMRSVWLAEVIPNSLWSPSRKSDFLDSLHFENQPQSQPMINSVVHPQVPSETGRGTVGVWMRHVGRLSPLNR